MLHTTQRSPPLSWGAAYNTVPAIVIVNGWKKNAFSCNVLSDLSQLHHLLHMAPPWMPGRCRHYTCYGFPLVFSVLCVLFTLYPVLTLPSHVSDCAVNVHKSCKSLLGECTSSTKKVKTALHCDHRKNKAMTNKLLILSL